MSHRSVHCFTKVAPPINVHIYCVGGQPSELVLATLTAFRYSSELTPNAAQNAASDSDVMSFSGGNEEPRSRLTRTRLTRGRSRSSGE